MKCMITFSPNFKNIFIENRRIKKKFFIKNRRNRKKYIYLPGGQSSPGVLH